MSKRLTPDDRRIWAKVAGTVTPRPGRSLPTPDEPEPERVKRRAPVEEAPKAKSSPGLTRPGRAPAKTPVPAERSGEKRVRRGRVEIDGRLDLHGMTQVEARAALVRFLGRLSAKDGRCGLVITGKGRAGGEGVLRRRLPEWLAEPDIAALSTGYAPAHARHGGDGAWYVFVRRAAERRGA